MRRKSSDNSLLFLFFSSSSTYVIAFLLLTMWTNEGDCYSGMIAPDPANPGKCIYHEETLKLGPNPGPGPCQRLTCLEDGSILIEGCGKLKIASCNRGERLNSDKPYPECCQFKYKCQKPDGSSFYITRDVAAEAGVATTTASSATEGKGENTA